MASVLGWGAPAQRFLPCVPKMGLRFLDQLGFLTTLSLSSVQGRSQLAGPSERFEEGTDSGVWGP